MIRDDRQQQVLVRSDGVDDLATRATKLTQAEAGRQLGIAQPRVNDLLRGRLDRFSIDALVAYLSRLGVHVRIETSTPKRTGRAA